MQKNFDLELKELQLQNERLLREVEEVRKLLENSNLHPQPMKEYLTVEECAELKGGAAKNTYKANRFLLPGCGNPKYSVFIAGRLAFPRVVVERWACVTDSTLVDYAKECGVTVVPEKYKRLALKAQAKNGGAK